MSQNNNNANNGGNGRLPPYVSYSREVVPCSGAEAPSLPPSAVAYAPGMVGMNQPPYHNVQYPPASGSALQASPLPPSGVVRAPGLAGPIRPPYSYVPYPPASGSALQASPAPPSAFAYAPGVVSPFTPIHHYDPLSPVDPRLDPRSSTLPPPLPVVRPTPADPDESPLFVNEKQLDRILKRRVTRQAYENALRKAAAGRYKYQHESRHKHAEKRLRGPNGRFLTQEGLDKLGPVEVARLKALAAKRAEAGLGGTAHGSKKRAAEDDETAADVGYTVYAFKKRRATKEEENATMRGEEAVTTGYEAGPSSQITQAPIQPQGGNNQQAITTTPNTQQVVWEPIQTGGRTMDPALDPALGGIGEINWGRPDQVGQGVMDAAIDPNGGYGEVFAPEFDHTYPDLDNFFYFYDQQDIETEHQNADTEGEDDDQEYEQH